MIKLIRNYKVEEEFEELEINAINRLEKELNAFQIEENIVVNCIYYTTENEIVFNIVPDFPVVAEKIQEILNMNDPDYEAY